MNKHNCLNHNGVQSTPAILIMRLKSWTGRAFQVSKLVLRGEPGSSPGMEGKSSSLSQRSAGVY